MKNKLLTILLVGVLVFATLSLASAKVRCPTCHGTGETDCPNCSGTGKVSEGDGAVCERCSGTGTITPKIYPKSVDAFEEDGATNVTAKFENQDDFEISGTATVTLGEHTTTTDEIVFPPHEEVRVSVLLDTAQGYTTSQLIRSVQVKTNLSGEITCPACDGTGTAGPSSTCPDCDGTGTIECLDCEGTGYVEQSAIADAGAINVPLIAGGAGAAVAIAAVGGASFVLLRRRRVSEKSLRRLSSNEFQDWVLKRLDGKPAASRDIALGIDGFSRLGEPISIKQSDSVGMAAVDSFAASLAKSRARGGTIVAFGFSDDAIRGKIRARTTYRLNIEMMTVQDLLLSRGR